MYAPTLIHHVLRYEFQVSWKAPKNMQEEQYISCKTGLEVLSWLVSNVGLLLAHWSTWRIMGLWLLVSKVFLKRFHKSMY